MKSDGGMLWYLLNKIRGGGVSNDRGNTPAFGFDGTNDYISSNATIGRTGYDMNVSGNVSTGSDGDGSYFWINGNRDGTGLTGTQANLDGGTTPLFDQTTSFTLSAKVKINTLPVNQSSGIFASNFDAGFHTDSFGNDIIYGLRGSSTVQNTSAGAFVLGTAFRFHQVYDAVTAKFYGYLNGTLLNAGGTAGPTTFSTNDWFIGDQATTGGTITSCNKYIYHACIRNKALTQAEIDADIALGNTAKNDPTIVAYYIPGNLQYNTQYISNPKDLDNASRTKGTGTTVTADYATAPDGTATADRVERTGTDIATSKCDRTFTTLTGSSLASKTFIVKAFVRVASGTDLFRLRCSHNGVADYYSSNQTATTVRQEFTFTQAFTSSSSGTGITAGLVIESALSAVDLEVWNVRCYLTNQTLRDESPNIGGFIGWKAQKVLSCRYKPAADFADSATAGALMVIPRAYMHDRASVHRPQIRYDDGLSARTSVATPLGVGFRGKVHVLGVIYRTGSAFATKFYTNGVLQDSDTRAAIPASSFIQSILESGRRSTTYFSGNIRDARIYTFTGSFTDADAVAIYNGGEPTSSGITKYLHYRPPVGEVGTTTQDQSNNDRDGTLNGGVTRNYI